MLNVAQLKGDLSRELLSDRQIAASESIERAALDSEQFGTTDRFGRQTVHLCALKSENVAGQIKSTDRASAVAQYLTGTHAAANDLVNVIGWRLFAKDFRISLIGHYRAYQFHRLTQRVAVDRRPCEPRADCIELVWRRVHGLVSRPTRPS